MGGQSMKYEDLYDEFINLFPEDKEFFVKVNIKFTKNDYLIFTNYGKS